jgi:hypothetical protein
MSAIKGGRAISRNRMSNSPEYRAWRDMQRRCFCSSCSGYRNYGGRGITVCDRWLGDYGFSNFLNDVGPRPSNSVSLDRINNDGNYEPGNCRWTSKREQIRNSRTIHPITINGRTLSIIEWCELFHIPYRRTKSRISVGWDPIDAIGNPKCVRTRDRLGRFLNAFA